MFYAPSFFNSLHDPEVFPEPEAFEPERWLDPEGSATQNAKNYLVFGSGPHKCIGIEYAVMNIAICLGNAAMLMEWDHEKTPVSEEVE